MELSREKGRALVCLLLFCAVMLSILPVRVGAEESSGASSVQTADKLEGFLRSAEEKPMTGARLQLQGEVQTVQAVTGADGGFVFSGLQEASYTLCLMDAGRSQVLSWGKVVTNRGQVTVTVSNKNLQFAYSKLPQTTPAGAIEGIALSKTEVQLTVGETYQMLFDTIPEGLDLPAIESVSTKPSVAKADGTGVIEALEPGKAVITFKTGDGGLAQTCTVTVQADQSSKYSWLIILAEGIVVGLIVLDGVVLYRSFTRKKIKKERAKMKK